MKNFKRLLSISVVLMSSGIFYANFEVKITPSVQAFVQKHIKSIAQQIVLNEQETVQKGESIIVTLDRFKQALTNVQENIFNDFVTTINQQYILGAAQEEVDSEQKKATVLYKLKEMFINLKQHVQEKIVEAQNKRKSRDKQVKEAALRELAAMTYLNMFLGEKFIESSISKGIVGDKVILIEHYMPYMNVNEFSKNKALLEQLNGNLSLDDNFDLALQAFPQKLSDVHRASLELSLNNKQKQTVIQNVKWFLKTSNKLLESRIQALPNKIAKIQRMAEVLQNVSMKMSK